MGSDWEWYGESHDADLALHDLDGRASRRGDQCSAILTGSVVNANV